VQEEAGLMKNHNITELEAGFKLIKYISLSEIEAGLMQEIISKCMLQGLLMKIIPF